MRGARRHRLGQRQRMQVLELLGQAEMLHPVAVDGIGVGGRNLRPCGEIGVVDLAHQTGEFHHHFRRPEAARLMARPRDQFLAHTAVQKGNVAAHGISTSFPG